MTYRRLSYILWNNDLNAMWMLSPEKSLCIYSPLNNEDLLWKKIKNL